MAIQRSPDAVERLYVYSLVVALLLVLLIVLLAFIARGQFVQQQQALADVNHRLAALESRLPASGSPNRNSTVPPAATRPSTAPATTRPAAARPGEAATRPANGTSGATPRESVDAVKRTTTTVVAPPDSPTTTRPTESAAAAAPEPPDALAEDAGVERLVGSVLTSDGDGWIISDRAAADRVLGRLRPLARTARWSGATYGRLALLARMLDEDMDVTAFLAKAQELGDHAADYYDYFIRDRMRNNAIDAAVQAAERFADSSDDSPQAMLLMAEIMLAQGHTWQALEVLPQPADAAKLTPGKRLRLGRAYVQTERFERLAEIVGALGTPPAKMTPDRDFLQSVAQLHAGKPAEALAVLDAVAAARPEDCLVQTWRGVALFRTRQVDAAREALAAATSAMPTCHTAWYWRGVIELSSGKADEAAADFEAALAAAPRYAPAWEARGAMALNRGEASTALEHLGKAIESDPRRAASHFLSAIAYAKTAREEQAAAALRAAFRLDRTYVERAAQTEVLKKMFDANEMRELSETPAPEAAESQPATP